MTWTTEIASHRPQKRQAKTLDSYIGRYGRALLSPVAFLIPNQYRNYPPARTDRIEDAICLSLRAMLSPKDP